MYIYLSQELVKAFLSYQLFVSITQKAGQDMELDFASQELIKYFFILMIFLISATSKNNADFSEKVKHLRDMGVTDMQALVALSSCNWEMVRAIEQLFS